jgi:hypothetical protein
MVQRGGPKCLEMDRGESSAPKENAMNDVEAILKASPEFDSSLDEYNTHIPAKTIVRMSYLHIQNALLHGIPFSKINSMLRAHAKRVYPNQPEMAISDKVLTNYVSEIITAVCPRQNLDSSLSFVDNFLLNADDQQILAFLQCITEMTKNSIGRNSLFSSMALELFDKIPVIIRYMKYADTPLTPVLPAVINFISCEMESELAAMLENKDNILSERDIDAITSMHSTYFKGKDRQLLMFSLSYVASINTSLLDGRDNFIENDMRNTWLKAHKLLNNLDYSQCKDLREVIRAQQKAA